MLETPAPHNPFGTGKNPCWDLGGTVAPFGPTPVASCTVEPGTLPSDNIFGDPTLARARGKSVAHGWVALLRPLAPGIHTIAVDSPNQSYTTKIVVKPGR